MNRSLVLAALVLASCKSHESTEVTVTTSGSAVPTKQASTTREMLEKSMKKHYASYGFTKFSCPEVGPTQSEVTCTMSADNGASYAMKITSKTKDDDGSWKSWDSPPSDVRVITAEELAGDIHDGVMAEVKKAHPKATAELGCGTSPIIFVNHKAGCKLTIHNPDKTVDISIDDSKDAFDWTAAAF
jgi:hypothetical protein